MALISGTVVTTDVAPEISINLASDLHQSYRKLAEILGVTRMDAVPEGGSVTVYASKLKGSKPSQVAEGVEIGLTEIQRTGTPVSMTLKKYRKLVTAEAIQKTGRDVAIYDTDRALIQEVRKDVKADFFTAILAGTGTATAGATLQAQLANNWSALETYYDDSDVEPVHFVNPADVATYLGSASITLQNAFGMSYVEDFLGLGTLIISPSVTATKVVSTAKQNLHCAYVPANGAIGQEFDMTTDETGLVGITHGRNLERASIESLLITGVKFFAEEGAGVIIGTVTPSN